MATIHTQAFSGVFEGVLEAFKVYWKRLRVYWKHSKGVLETLQGVLEVFEGVLEVSKVYRRSLREYFVVSGQLRTHVPYNYETGSLY